MSDEYFKKYRHTPVHLFLRDYWYFITAGTHQNKKYLRADADKEMFFGVLKEMLSKCSGGLHGWVILNDHYHILVKLKDVFILPDLIRKVHSKSAVILNKEHVRPGRKVWYQYWDECVRNERDFYVKLNYIHLNPIKHGYVDDIASYRFSSYRHYLQLEGATWLNDVLEQFPPSSTIKGDDF